MGDSDTCLSEARGRKLKAKVFFLVFLKKIIIVFYESESVTNSSAKG